MQVDRISDPELQAIETIRISPRAAYNKMRELEAENARLTKESKLLCECGCPACGDMVYFHELGQIDCGCGACKLELTVNTYVREE